MFTGLIKGIGKIVAITPFSGGRKIAVQWDGFARADLAAGASVAIDGACLSVERTEGDICHFLAVEETIARTTLGQWSVSLSNPRNPGDAVNIELPATPQTFLDGHIVQGHIDCTGTIESFAPVGAQRTLKIRYPFDFSKYAANKGSVAIDGISLTIANCGDGWLECAITPDTIARTTLQFKQKGDSVNIEFDVLAKYVEALLRYGDGMRDFRDDDIAAAY